MKSANLWLIHWSDMCLKKTGMSPSLMQPATCASAIYNAAFLSPNNGTMNKPLITFSDSSVAPEFDHPRPDRLVSGNPLRATRSHYEKPGMAAGIWSCETGAWNIAFADGKDEFFCVTEGRIRITDSSGAAKEFGPGDACVIPAGFTGTFEVLEPVKKYYVIVEPA